MVQIYKRKNYCIYSSHKQSHAYIVHNKNKEFSNGHTHISNYNTAKFIINMAINKTIPKTKVNDYILLSIIRVSEDKEYIKKLEEKRCKTNAQKR